MSTTEALRNIIGLNCCNLSDKEKHLLEAELFVHLYDELKDFFRKQYKDYFNMLKFTPEKESEMLESNFLSLMIKDVLSTEEYTVEGIALYTGIHEDIINEVIYGRNANPSANLLRRLIDLHRTVRQDLYCVIFKKIKSFFIN